MGNSLLGFGVSLNNTEPITTSVALAKAAEISGFSTVSVPEAPHQRSGWMTLMAIAQHTSSISLAAGIVVPYLRRLSTIAMDALALNEVSGGRVRVGLGIPLWKINMYGYTLQNTKPLESMRDAFEILKALLHGDPAPRGNDFISGVRTTGGRKENHCSALEVQFMGELSQAVVEAKLSTTDANAIILEFANRYQDQLKDPDYGKPFNECVNVETLVPSKEWMNVYNEVKKELEEHNLHLKST